MVKIIIDTREKAPKQAIDAYGGKMEIKQLEVGDYACSAMCCGWERKEQDVFNLSRTLTQVSELKRAYKHAYLVITLTPEQFYKNNRVNHFALYGFMASLKAQHMTPWFEPDYNRMLTIMHRTILKNHDGKNRDYESFNHVRHVTAKDLQINILTTLPGIGRDKAELIIDNFDTVKDFMNATAKEIQSLPGFGKKTAEKIINCLNHSQYDIIEQGGR